MTTDKLESFDEIVNICAEKILNKLMRGNMRDGVVDAVHVVISWQRQIREQQPAPDVSALVEALEAVVGYDESVEDRDTNLRMRYADMIKKARATLATYRKQQEGQS